MDGDNRFVDFMQDGGGEMPFAIECVGNEFVIGKSALESATKQLAPNAFTNIFDTCKGVGTFQFAGRPEQLNKLPYYAIKYYIGKILSDRFYGEVGTIDSNISKLPLILLFTPELDTDKRLFISSPFEKGGFQNLCSVSYHQLLLPVVMDSLPEKQRAKVVIMVSADNNDLLLQLYDAATNESLGDTVRIEGQGCDPRLKQAMDLIWAGLYNYNYQPRGPENEILQDAALRFLNGQARTVNDVLCMSDGSMQDYCLSRDDLDMSAMGEAYRLVSHHMNEILNNNGLNFQQCQVILVGKTSTDYFKNIFGQMPFTSPISKVSEKEKTLMLDRLLSMVKKFNYKVCEIFPKIDKEEEIPVESATNPVTPAPSAVGMLVPSLEDKRKVRGKMADIKAKLRGNDTDDAYAIYEELKEWLSEKGFIDWNEELEKLKKSINRSVNNTSVRKETTVSTPNPDLDSSKKTIPGADLKNLRRAFHRETANIKALARIGRKKDAIDALEKLKARLHPNNIHDFDVDLKDIQNEYGLGNVVKKITGMFTPSKKKMTEAAILLQKGLFAEAKRKFASEEGNSEMAQACSKLIRAKRNVDSYASGVDSVRRSHNMTSKQNAIRELENSMALYRQYGLSTAEIEQIIEQYKTI